MTRPVLLLCICITLYPQVASTAGPLAQFSGTVADFKQGDDDLWTFSFSGDFAFRRGAHHSHGHGHELEFSRCDLLKGGKLIGVPVRLKASDLLKHFPSHPDLKDKYAQTLKQASENNQAVALYVYSGKLECASTNQLTGVEGSRWDVFKRPPAN